MTEIESSQTRLPDILTRNPTCVPTASAWVPLFLPSLFIYLFLSFLYKLFTFKIKFINFSDFKSMVFVSIFGFFV